MEPTRPVLRYHGGKWQLGKWIIKHFPAHQVYIEPFCGAASILMLKPRSHSEVINDLSVEIVNVFRVMQDPTLAKRLEGLIRFTPYSREEFELSYVASMALQNDWSLCGLIRLLQQGCKEGYFR